jgi:hypothetical protein
MLWRWIRRTERSAHSRPPGAQLSRARSRRSAWLRAACRTEWSSRSVTAGYTWTFPGEARDPTQITPGALVAAGDEGTAAVCHVAGLEPAGGGTIVHLRLLPGLAGDYRQLAGRALAS